MFGKFRERWFPFMLCTSDICEHRVAHWLSTKAWISSIRIQQTQMKAKNTASWNLHCVQRLQGLTARWFAIKNTRPCGAGDRDLDLEPERQGQMFLTSTQAFLNHKVLISKRGVTMGGLLQVTAVKAREQKRMRLWNTACASTHFPLFKNYDQHHFFIKTFKFSSW